MDYTAATTIGALRGMGYPQRTVKDEMRDNLMVKLARGEPVFPGIVGYDKTVIPELVNAILSRHDFILLGLRGQAKTRILRALATLLDEYLPVIAGCEINSSPYAPVSRRARDLVSEHGDDTPIEWIGRSRRYGEKLATPDVTISDLIGDIDPIKAASQRLHYAHEGVIHFGIIPRMNRGVFAVNELPDLQPRIQVGLLNIMEEKDIQIRGFPVRIPLDVMIVFSANPEDYTNRGTIITPLKDRIDSQILTHYPVSREYAMAITDQEAWTERSGGVRIDMPSFLRETVEEIAFQARSSEFIDQTSGVSTRMTIAAMENLVSQVEKRCILQGKRSAVPRMCDLSAVIPAMTGKLELVYEGEQEGEVKVAEALIGRAVKEVFGHYFPAAFGEDDERDACYREVLAWFEEGQTVEISDTMDDKSYYGALNGVDGLRKLAGRHVRTENRVELSVAMEFLLEGLHQHSRISKSVADGRRSYSDMMGSLFER
ncbi:MAG: magnesium chelatase [Gemmatimonadetes bacterium]|nr:magnesium chelatase [Gemmatimonadota bacterium]MYG84642.1 magnesium chelatase [Gemmatimonadota bacterium]MYJ90842.1 magnesium chelatase [Gemmatimonadota bacterium]